MPTRVQAAEAHADLTENPALGSLSGSSARGALLLTVSTLRSLVHWGTGPPLGQLSTVGSRLSIVGNVRNCFLSEYRPQTHPILFVKVIINIIHMY